MPCTKAQEIDVAAFVVDPRAPEWAEFRDHFPGCAECSRAIAHFAALKAALAGEDVSASAHLSEAQIAALAEPSPRLASDERVRLEAHVAGCAPCRTELAVARRFDFAAIAGPRKAFSRIRRWPALAAAAVLALAVPAALQIWRNAQETRATPSPPTAAAEPSAPTRIVAEIPAQAEPEPSPVLPPAPIEIAKEVPVATPPVERPVADGPAAEAPLAEAEKPEPPRPVLIAALVPTEPPLYAPGALATTASVRIESAARGSGAGAPAPQALGPAHVGATAHDSPTLYWFLPEATAHSVELTVTLAGTASPLLETTIPGPLEAGVHRVSLAEHGARLQPELDYRWFVALVLDPERRSRDVVTGAGIRYTPPGPEQSAHVSGASSARAAHVYAESGLWYDALDQLSSWLLVEPDAATLHSHRAALLQQVGLDEAAAFELGGAPGAH